MYDHVIIFFFPWMHTGVCIEINPNTAQRVTSIDYKEKRVWFEML